MKDTKLTLELSVTPLPNELRQALTDAGYEFCTLAQTDDDEPARRNLYALVREGVEDTPGTGTFESYPAFMERIYYPSYRRHADSQFLAAFEGAWVGLSSFVVQPDGEGLFGLTAVTRAHRGKGLARALKVEALNYAQCSGVKTITTENHPENTPILKLNRALGFVETSG